MKQFFTLSLLLLSISLFSQEFKKNISATITFKSGESKSVLITSDDINNSTSIKYKTPNSEFFQTITPENIESIIAHDNSVILKTFKNANESFFLNQIIGGAADLYYYLDTSQSARYVAYTEDFGYKTLNSYKTSVKKDGSEFNKNTKEYLGVLNLMFSDCKDEIELKNIKFTARSLANAFTSYNECRNELNFTSSSLDKKTKFRIGILGGADINSLKANTSVAENGKGETNFSVGTEFVLIPAFFQSKLMPFISLNYAKTGGTADYLSTPEFNQLYLDFKLIELYSGLRYSLAPMSSKLNPFIGASIGKSFVLDHENSILKIANDNSTPSKPLYDGNPYKNLGKSMKLGFHFQAGINYRLTPNQGVIFKADYSSMYESLGEFQFNRFKLEVGYYFDL